jgi:hypothetical protein
MMLDWAAAMAQILARLESQGFRTSDEETNAITPPVAFVSYPEDLDPHGTYGEGVSTAELQVTLVVAEATARNTRSLMEAWGSPGPTGAVAILESGTYAALDELHVVNVHFGVVEITDVRYAAIILDLHIGKGAI